MATFQVAAAVAVAESFVVLRVAPQYAMGGVWVWNFIAVFFLYLFGIAVYSIILYPKLFSPLRTLPGPKVGIFLPILLTARGVTF